MNSRSMLSAIAVSLMTFVAMPHGAVAQGGTLPAWRVCANEARQCYRISNSCRKADCLDAVLRRCRGAMASSDAGAAGGAAIRARSACGRPAVQEQRANKCDNLSEIQLERRPKAILRILCKRNFNLTMKRRHGFVALARYIKDEDGTKNLVRTGFETQLYRHLKHRIVTPSKFKKKLSPNKLFWRTLQAMRIKTRGRSTRKRVDINAIDALITAHNVTRLLARPEQWWIDRFPAMASGKNRYIYDAAAPIFKDLLGQKSANKLPTLYDHWGDKNFDHNRITTRFFNAQAPFTFNWSSRLADDGWSAAHWNGGMHYYFWVGAIVFEVGDDLSLSLGGGAAATRATYLYELYQKLLTGNRTRANFQLREGFLAGAKWWKTKKAAFAAVKAVAPQRIK